MNAIETAPFVTESRNGESGTVFLEVTEITTDYSDSNTYGEDFGPNKANASVEDAKIALIQYIKARTNAVREDDPEWYAFDAVGNSW